MFMFVGDLAAEGITSPTEAVTAAKDALPNYWPFPTGTRPAQREMAKGRFFERFPSELPLLDALVIVHSVAVC